METTPEDNYLLSLLEAGGLSATLIYRGDEGSCPQCLPMEMKTAA